MDSSLLQQQGQCQWLYPPRGPMRVPAIFYASEDLIKEMDDNVLEQISRVAALPGIATAAYCMPDAHWGYGFPIGGVAAFDAERGGVVSAGGVGFDISCGVRTLLTGLPADEIASQQEQLANQLFAQIPAGVGSTGDLRLDQKEMDAMLSAGARWAVRRGYGVAADLGRIEHQGEMVGADPAQISDLARRRQRAQMGTLGSGNHYLEVQQITAIYDEAAAAELNLRVDEVVISLHCGSRGLGHQVATEFSRSMVQAARQHKIPLLDRELACAPINSAAGQAYLGAMRAASNCALANRQILSHLVRQTFQKMFKLAELPLLYDVSHNTCNQETHLVDNVAQTLYVHRKGATRAYGPGHADLPADLRSLGQPVLIGGTMGTASYILLGQAENATLSFSSACH
ncbi:MAG: RtcB family protein, partial [Lentisphaerae bacterium]|nr:RtcB family protein [Lentisphaerota bacterium]